MRLFLILSSLLLLSCTSVPEGMQELTLRSGEQSVTVYAEIADGPAERSQGLMHRTELAEDHGMLFIFEQPQTLSFWMKNTKIPLDIVFFDAKGQFVSMQTMEPCLPTESPAGTKTSEHDPCQRYISRGPAKYALEVNAGFAKQRGIGEGWELVHEQ